MSNFNRICEQDHGIYEKVHLWPNVKYDLQSVSKWKSMTEYHYAEVCHTEFHQHLTNNLIDTWTHPYDHKLIGLYYVFVCLETQFPDNFKENLPYRIWRDPSIGIGVALSHRQRNRHHLHIMRSILPCKGRLISTTLHNRLYEQSMYFFSLALQPQFGPWPTSMTLHRFTSVF
jgi:hypothetical protein